jgi:hypothetical protein
MKIYTIGVGEDTLPIHHLLSQYTPKAKKNQPKLA